MFNLAIRSSADQFKKNVLKESDLLISDEFKPESQQKNKTIFGIYKAED